MTRLLPLVLSRFDLPEAELHAARLDGELFAIDECFGPIDLAPQASLRAASLAAILPARLIAEQRTAAWVLGALLDPPAQHQLCADTAARYRFAGAARFTVREVVLEPDDTSVLAGLRVTTPLRTAIDLARFCEEFGEVEADIVAELARTGGFELPGAIAGLERRRHLPGKVRAAQRLRAALRRASCVSPR
ncbi:MAG: type IV toxin-antitoxin system AbiEi family antitoxin [Microbacteriaceae bacterium]|nr:type IV toxin-antitoxin system AbiEi family antitoxin [Microbacteriaceae bacterium]